MRLNLAKLCGIEIKHANFCRIEIKLWISSVELKLNELRFVELTFNCVNLCRIEFKLFEVL